MYGMRCTGFHGYHRSIDRTIERYSRSIYLFKTDRDCFGNNNDDAIPVFIPCYYSRLIIR